MPDLQTFLRGTRFYRAYTEQPADVIERGDGLFYREQHATMPDGSVQTSHLRVCEDCWQLIPRYMDAPNGWVSLDSDGDRNGNFPKHRKIFNGVKDNGEPRESTEAVQKLVCLPCYLYGFARWYPGIRLPPLNDAVHQSAAPLPVVPSVLGREFVANPDGL